jgi:hypothetical protein
LSPDTRHLTPTFLDILHGQSLVTAAFRAALLCVILAAASERSAPSFSDGGLKGRFLVVGDTLVLAPPPPRLR